MIQITAAVVALAAAIGAALGLRSRRKPRPPAISAWASGFTRTRRPAASATAGPAMAPATRNRRARPPICARPSSTTTSWSRSIRCGVPGGTAMPHFDKFAWTKGEECFGMTEEEVGDKKPPTPDCGPAEARDRSDRRLSRGQGRRQRSADGRRLRGVFRPGQRALPGDGCRQERVGHPLEVREGQLPTFFDVRSQRHRSALRVVSLGSPPAESLRRCCRLR